MTRLEVNQRSIYLSHRYCNLLLEHCTGLGKTKSSLDIVRNLKGRGYIILAEKSHIKNWHEEIIKHSHEEILIKSDIFLYASLHKYKNTKIDWIIFDEAHHLTSDKRLEIIKTIKSTTNIFLTATIEDDQYEQLLSIYDSLYRFKITLKQAIDSGILPKPEIRLVPITLDDKSNRCELIINQGDKKQYIKEECLFKDRWKYLKQYKNIQLKVKCTEVQKYNYFTNQFDYYKDRYFKERQEFLKFKWLNSGSQRKRFLAEVKTPYANEIILDSNRKNIRYICFCGSINQSEILGGVGNIVHSKNKNNQLVIDNFNNKKINNLFAVGMLQEGVNLFNIEQGLIIQLDSKLRSFFQKMGRSLRSKETPIQYIFYVKNTRDEEYLNNIIKGIEEYIIK